MEYDVQSLWNLIIPVLQWGAAILVCVVLGLWLAGVIQDFAEEEVPGRLACPRCGYDVRATPARCPECGQDLPPELHMPIYTIPEGAGPFIVAESKDGQFAVAEERSLGQQKADLLFIPCRDEAQARDIADRLNRGEHDGSIQVNLLPEPTEALPAAETAGSGEASPLTDPPQAPEAREGQ